MREEHVDRRVGGVDRHLSDGACQRIDHVGQAPGLGPWLAFGGEERDAKSHARMVEGQTGPGPAGCASTPD